MEQKEKRFTLKYFKEDLFGGVTAGIVALPLALAFGVQSGLGAAAGLYGAMILGLLAAAFGGTATQVSGPTGPMTVVTAMVVTEAMHFAGNIENGMALVIGSFILAGFFQIVFGYLRFGKTIRYLPYPVLSGFMSGIGVIIILLQIYPFLGSPSESSTVAVLMNIQKPLSQISWSDVMIGSLTIAIIYLFPKISKTIPSPLVALLAATGTAVVMKLDIPIIGQIPSGLPALRVKDLMNFQPNMFWLMLEFAATLAALGAIDSLLTSVIADNITKTKHDSNQELIGQGIGNICSGLVGGLPGAGATMRTVVNVNAGGVTRLSGMIHGLLLFAILLGLGKYVSHIPLSVLAGILITVGIGIIDYRAFSNITSVPRTDAVILMIVLTITVFGSLLHAVGVGIVLACVLFMKQASDLAEQATSVTTMKQMNEGQPPESKVLEEFKELIYIKRLYGPLFFGVTSHIQDLATEIRNSVKILIIQMEQVPNVDHSGQYVMEQVVSELQAKGVLVLLTGVQPQPMGMFKRIGLVPLRIAKEHIFENFEACEQWLKETILSDEKGLEKILEDLRRVKKSKVAYRM